MSPLDKWDPTDFSNTMLVWDSKARKIVQELKGDPIPLAALWALKPNATYSYSISNAGNSIWMFKREASGKFSYKKAADLFPSAPPCCRSPSTGARQRGGARSLCKWVQRPRRLAFPARQPGAHARRPDCL